MRKKYTGENARHRRNRQAERRRHIRAIKDNEVSEELPDILLPDIFSEIHEIYRKSLKSVPDPRMPNKRVYPLHLILHRIKADEILSPLWSRLGYTPRPYCPS